MSNWCLQTFEFSPTFYKLKLKHCNKMKEEESSPPPIDVTKPPLTVEQAEKRFKTMKLLSQDLNVLKKPPQKLWDDSFLGEAVTDDCHPSNTSFILGASGGALTGLATGFFSTNRVPLPVRTIIPGPFLPRIQTLVRTSIIGSSVMWRIAKRSLLGTIMFAVLECDFKDLVKKPSEKWKGSVLAGSVCGGIFGLRGGFPGFLVGIALFTALPGGLELYSRKEQIRSKIFNP